MTERETTDDLSLYALAGAVHGALVHAPRDARQAVSAGRFAEHQAKAAALVALEVMERSPASRMAAWLDGLRVGQVGWLLSQGLTRREAEANAAAWIEMVGVASSGLPTKLPRGVHVDDLASYAVRVASRLLAFADGEPDCATADTLH